jgi:hypothetical protein
MERMDVILFSVASVTGGVWYAYLVEYTEDQEFKKEQQ